MATATMSDATRPGDRGEPGPPEADPRVAAFCSPDLPELFHAFAYASDVWKPDPFDVESIHRGARDVLRRIVGRVLEPSGHGRRPDPPAAGRGRLRQDPPDARLPQRAPRAGQGYCGYMQMTAYTDDYGRYVLNNLIESLDKPYDEPGRRPRG